ncbi:MAG: metallophosphoesterase [Myxococcota bacterium]
MLDLPNAAEQLEAALAKRSTADQARIRAILHHVHVDALHFLEGKDGARGSSRPEFSRAHGLLHRAEDLLHKVGNAVLGTPDPTGQIYGTGTYESLDLGWTEALALWIENGHERATFSTSPATIDIPDTVDLSIIGDWGTGDFGTEQSPSGSALIGRHVSQSLKPAITIHLGDVYYAGTEDNERSKLVDIFPWGTSSSFTLNSNHEMYPGAKAYFDVALADRRFAAQNATSYFCLQNQHWAIVGLDTAYEADYWDMYLQGTLKTSDGRSPQLDFLRQVAQSGRQLIILTHHNPLELSGAPNPLWGEVTQALANTPSASRPVYWYYGHAHNAAVYLDVPGSAGVPTILPRLSGHAAVPYTVSTDLTESRQISWLERAYIHGDSGLVRNGFSTLALDGPQLTESMLDQEGNVSWTRTATARQ